ncbi:MAG: sugar phosphorylase [Candidatus Thermofonsia Clade 3 bacterium]|uniref:Sugar phosphorylase n=1 Tax=Candidatus Thermofonsia Clade 3 bacterium TaxID=2364212 RepID=A0A2M8QGZ0_9CHLR|nr:MAG: sugar phosphorylase [Candidatus Thermofonsia Clade 3 bacterium]
MDASYARARQDAIPMASPDRTTALSKISALCRAIYGDVLGAAAYARLQQVIAAHPPLTPKHSAELTQRDAMLITYGDQVRAPGQPPLQTLADFCARHLTGAISTIHLLPFYPYTSDDGFAVVDYRAVNPALGSWADIARLGESFRLMFDAVINHVSAQSAWFQGYLRGEAQYQDYFITVTDRPDLSSVVRPRALPLLTPFDALHGRRTVWTTFSADQIDLNYANPHVLAEMVDVLLFYAARGADFIRLDAVAYLWKEIGTPCIYLPNTHRVIQIFRAALDAVAPHVRLVTETNVPHHDNITYFGDGFNEAQLVYNFALPPLVLHTLQTGDARMLTQWASALSLPSKHVTFLNFLASHDGIGLNPVRGILSGREIHALVTRTLDVGGLISESHTPDGAHRPYEMNVNYFDALSFGARSEAETMDRFIAAHAILMAMQGMPALYFHSLFGSRGWPEGVRQLGHRRAINRQKLDRAELEHALAEPTSRRTRLFTRLTHLLRARAGHPAFHPCGEQRIVSCVPSVFALLRIAPDDRARALCLVNVSAEDQLVQLPWRALLGTNNAVRDLLSGARLNVHGPSLELEPYEARWLSVP